MKNLYLLLLTLFLFASCTKKNSLEAVQPANTGLITEVENLSTNREAQKLSYHLLSNADKAALWNAQIDYYMTSDLNDQQKEMLQTLKSIIKPQIFDKAYFIDNYEAFAKSWSAAAEKVFPKDVLNAIVSRIHSGQYAHDLVIATNARNFSPKTQSIVVNSVNPKPLVEDPSTGCTCSTSSTYCAQFESCSSSYYGGCSSSSSGCGFFLFYSCNGQCGAGS